MTTSTMRIAGDSSKPLTKRINFTNTAMKALSFDAGRDVCVFDTKVPALCWRVQLGGAGAFYFYKRVLGRPKRIKIGGAEIGIEEARRLAKKMAGNVADGKDPAEEARRKRQEKARQALTLQTLWERFEADKKATMKPRSLASYKSYVEGPLSALMNMPVDTITPKAVLDRHRRIGTDSGHAYANAAMRVLRAIFNFAVAIEDVKTNPVGVLKKRWFTVKPRTTKIADDQLADWFDAIGKMRDAHKPMEDGHQDAMPDITARTGADYLEFVLFTGLRREEASQLTWDRVDLSKGTITIVETKNGVPLFLPLARHIRELLARRASEAGGSQWVFPSPGRKGKAHFAEPRFAIERLTALSAIQHTVHDLRRSFVSAAVRLVPYAVAKALVNHSVKSTDVTLDYSILTTDELRPHVEAIAAFFLKAAQKQGQPA